jgi:uncharacterized membrane protein
MPLGYFVVRSLDVPIEAKLAMLAAVLVACIGYLIGWFVGPWIARDADVDTTKFQVVGAANLVGWLVPIVGMALSALAWRFGQRSESSRMYYFALSTVGCLLAMANAGYGAVTVDAFDALAQAQEVAPGSGRSWARCQFAAIEQWSPEDINSYCRNHQPTAAELQEFERLAKEYEADRAG